VYRKSSTEPSAIGMRHSLLYVCRVGERGGAETILGNLLKLHDRTKFAPAAVFLTEGPFYQEVREMGIPCTVVRAGRFRELYRTAVVAFLLAKWIRHYRADCVVSHMSLAHAYAALPARSLGAKTVVMLYGRINPSLALDRVAFRLPTDRILSCAQDITDHAKRFLSRANRERLRTYRMGIDLSAFDPAVARDSLRGEFGIPPHVPIVGMIGRFEESKGQEYFLQAARLVAETHPTVRFVLVGGTQFGIQPWFKDRLHQLTLHLGLEERVVFAGFRNDMPQCLAAIDVVVHAPIDDSPGGVTMLEAMAMGKPVVTTGCGDRSEWMTNEEHGVIIPPRDPEAMARAIVRLLNNPSIARKMGAHGRERAKQVFSAEAMVREVESYYSELLLSPRA